MIIFVTVGTQHPFDRLIKSVDFWAENNRYTNVFAQTGRSKYRAQFVDTFDFIPPDEFHNRFQAADFIIGHAGMGTIITAMEYGKPLLMMPRDTSRGEHTTNHQMDTVRHFALSQYNIDIAYSGTELIRKIDMLVKKPRGKLTPFTRTPSLALIEAIQNFIENCEK
ncbi:MAG: glycosyltransferase [Candidatus Electrothrix sp. Rat3]|nr:glycosyltransferase [Candidatus Electrothrix rattekaaiensis]